MDTSFGEDDDPKNSLTRKREGLDAEGRGRVAMQVGLLENSPQLTTSTSPLKEQEKKRLRRSEDGEEDNSKSRSALSFEKSDRAQ